MFPLETLLSQKTKQLRQKLLEHPFWKSIEDGTLDKKRLALFALQDYWLVAQADRIDTLAIASMQDPILRRLLLQRLVQQAKQGYNTLFDFGISVGLSKRDFADVEPLAGCMALTTFFYWMIDHAGDMEKIIAIDASKEIFSLLCVRVQPALIKNYGLDEKQVAFFTAHDGVDEKLRPVTSYIETHCKTASVKKLINRAVELSYGYELLFYDTILL